LLQGLDADGNIILASDGAVGPNDVPATFDLTIPPSIGNVTLTDQTTTAAGSATTALANANLGDTIALAAVGTPAFVGVPIDAVIDDQATRADLGNVYAPVAIASAAPYAVADVTTPVRIAGATFESRFNEGPQANGFIAAYLGVAPDYAPTVTAYTITGGTTPTTAHSGSYALDEDYDNEPITDLLALGNANYTSGETTSGLYFAGYFSTGALVSEPLTSTTNNASLNISTQETTSADAGAGNATFTASEDAGGYVGTALDIFSTTYVSVAPENATSAPSVSANLITGSSAPISIAATINGSAATGENPLFVVLTSGDLYVVSPAGSVQNVTVALPTGIGTPLSIVAHGPYAYVLTSSGGISTCPLYPNPTAGCSYVPNLVTNPSSDRHAMALGPDGKLWIAITTTMIRYDPSTGLEAAFGNNDYAQVVASADGRIYAVSTAGEIDTIP
jgi:hypothetical protein